MAATREPYAPRPPAPRRKTHPHHPGRGECLEAAPPRPEEVFVLRLRPDGAKRRREPVGRDRPLAKRESRSEPPPERRCAGSRANGVEARLAGLLRRIL